MRYKRRAYQTYLPLWSGRVGNSKYLKSGLTYEKEHDRFRCPQGKYLTPTPAIYDNHKRYASSPEDCRACPQASTCPAKTRPPSHQRFLLRSLDQDLFEDVQSKMEEPRFRTKLAERMWKIEGLFAEAKQNHCLSRAKYRGRSKVQIQAYLSAMVQNLKRLVCVIYLGVLARWLSHQSQPHISQRRPKTPRLFQQGPVVFCVNRTGESGDGI